MTPDKAPRRFLPVFSDYPMGQMATMKATRGFKNVYVKYEDYNTLESELIREKKKVEYLSEKLSEQRNVYVQTYSGQAVVWADEHNRVVAEMQARIERLEKALKSLADGVDDYAGGGCIECFSDGGDRPSLSDVLETAREALEGEK